MKIITKYTSNIIVTSLLFVIIMGYQNSIAQDTIREESGNKKKITFRDPDDGAFDISQFLMKPGGFMPVPFIITEPAVGYGGGAALLFFHPHKKKYDVKVPPNISGVAGLGTQNGTWAAGLFHFHVFGPDKVRTITAVGKPVVHIKYYGNNNEYLDKNPVSFKIDSWTAIQRVQVRIGTSNLFVGGSYVFFTTKNSIDTLPDRPIINKIIKKLGGTSTLSMLQPIVNWDSRNNIFTPSTGMNAGLSFSYNATWLGADENYYKLSPYFFGYKPISKKIFSGWRFDADFMMGDAPPYALPFVDMRGVPAMRYQSDNILLVETEWRFNVYKRWSLDGFGGTGKAFTSFNAFGQATWVYSYGIGFRYLLAKAFGMHAGMDFAWSNNGEFAFYFIFGSAWNR